MLEPFEVDELFNKFIGFNCFESASTTSNNTKTELSYLNLLLQPLTTIEPPSTSSNSPLVEFSHQLKNNLFEDALQTLKNNPNSLQEIDNQLPVTQLAQFFLFLLRKKLPRIVKSIWNNNPLLASYFIGKAIQVEVINAQGNRETQTWQLNLPELIVNFKHSLSGRHTTIIKSMWKNNTQLALYFSGQAIQVPVINAQENLEMQTWQLTLADLIIHFKSALASHCRMITKFMWDNNALLVAYFSGKAIQVEVINVQGSPETQTWQLSLTEQIVNFKSALSSQYPKIIKSIWETSPLLSAYLSGQTIEIQAPNEHGILETQTKQLQPSELIAHFKSALASHCLFVIQSMWGNENSRLQAAVRALNDIQLIELTDKVLSSHQMGNSKFITDFLNFISNKAVLETCLKIRHNTPESPYVKNQIKALNICMESLNSAATQLNMNIDSTTALLKHSIFGSSTGNPEKNHKRRKEEELLANQNKLLKIA